MPLYGIDISKYQAGIDLAAVPADFVIVYITGGVGVQNPVWRAQVDGALRAGKRVLGYHYAHELGSQGTAQQEAAFFTRTLGAYVGKMDALVLDWESDNVHDIPWAMEWFDAVRSTTGRPVMLYTGYAQLKSGADFGPIYRADIPLWEAAYVAGYTRIQGYYPPAGREHIPWWFDPAIWQFTSVGRLPGWGGDLDLNVFFGGWAEWDAMWGRVSAAGGAAGPIKYPYSWPLDHEVTPSQWFGANPNNGVNPAGGHTGIDYPLEIGTPVYAPGPGVIELAGDVDDTWRDNLLWLRGGRAAVLNCGDAEPTFTFGHMHSFAVAAGQRVNRGDLIGLSGNTGYSSGPHIHFEALSPGYVLNSPTLGRVDPRAHCTITLEEAFFHDLGLTLP